jgi:Inner membrane protein YgaP-like, transmembrane domain
MNFANESGIDRIIRAVLGIVLIALAASSAVTGALGIVFWVVGAVLLLTGIVGFCPLYALLRIRTKHA